MSKHNWKRYNPQTACIEHVLFEDTNGTVLVTLDVFEEMLTGLKFERSDNAENYEVGHANQPLRARGGKIPRG
jgi:hypothetical protein